MYGFTELVSLVLNFLRTMDIFMLLFSLLKSPKGYQNQYEINLACFSCSRNTALLTKYTLFPTVTQ